MIHNNKYIEWYVIYMYACIHKESKYNYINIILYVRASTMTLLMLRDI